MPNFLKASSPSIRIQTKKCHQSPAAAFFSSLARPSTMAALISRRKLQMSKIPFVGIAVLAAMFALPATAQDAAKKNAALKPADPELKVVVDSWNDVGRKLIAMAEDFPEDKYDFKPTPAQRSFAEQLLHAAGANYYFINLVIGEQPPAEADANR